MRMFVGMPEKPGTDARRYFLCAQSAGGSN